VRDTQGAAGCSHLLRRPGALHNALSHADGVHETVVALTKLYQIYALLQRRRKERQRLHRRGVHRQCGTAPAKGW
jgi:hypothetical protein